MFWRKDRESAGARAKVIALHRQGRLGAPYRLVRCKKQVHHGAMSTAEIGVGEAGGVEVGVDASVSGI